jgi:hypothetical protein
MRDSLSKEGIRYNEVVGQDKIQDILPFLVPTPVPEAPTYPIETYSSKTYMSIEVSSYKELLRDGHTTNQRVQRPLELSLNALIKTYLRGISTNNKYGNNHAVTNAIPILNYTRELIFSNCIGSKWMEGIHITLQEGYSCQMNMVCH